MPIVEVKIIHTQTNNSCRNHSFLLFFERSWQPRLEFSLSIFMSVSTVPFWQNALGEAFLVKIHQQLPRVWNFKKKNLLRPQVILEGYAPPNRCKRAPFFWTPQACRSAMRPSEEVLHWCTLRWNLARKKKGNKRRKHNLPEVSGRCVKSCFFEGDNFFRSILPLRLLEVLRK